MLLLGSWELIGKIFKTLRINNHSLNFNVFDISEVKK